MNQDHSRFVREIEDTLIPAQQLWREDFATHATTVGRQRFREFFRQLLERYEKEAGEEFTAKRPYPSFEAFAAARLEREDERREPEPTDERRAALARRREKVIAEVTETRASIGPREFDPNTMNPSELGKVHVYLDGSRWPSALGRE